MIARNDLVDFLPSELVHFAADRLIVDEIDGILQLAHAGRGIVLAHSVVRNENAQIESVIVAVADALQSANHLEANAVQQDDTAH